MSIIILGLVIVVNNYCVVRNSFQFANTVTNHWAKQVRLLHMLLTESYLYQKQIYGNKFVLNHDHLLSDTSTGRKWKTPTWLHLA